MNGTVYLIHFEQPVSKNHTTQHYLGFSEDLDMRLFQHLHYPAPRLMQVVKERRIRWALARTWEGDRHFERKLKNRKNAPQLCPICQGKKKFKAYDPLPF